VAQIRPKLLLDVGCAWGTFTKKLAEYCGEIIAVDLSPAVLERAERENGAANIKYLSASALQLPFADGQFDTVIERGSLHHVREWQVMLCEMVRVASGRVLALEPIDDARSDGKRAAVAAHHLFLELQAEVGYAHYEHLTESDVRSWCTGHGIEPRIELVRRDQPVPFEAYFEPWEHFAKQSARPDYWMERREEFRRSLGDTPLCADDLMLVELDRTLS
jgi:2-polyprenyl-3-methyl-5-hydroxy-6-metoxy-1,4-benzoquinol methylase